MPGKKLFYNDEDKKIFLLIIFIITSFALIAEVSGFTIYSKQSQQFLQSELQQQLSNRSKAISHDLIAPIEEIRNVTNSPLLEKLVANQHDRSDFPAIFMDRDLSAIKVTNKNNKVIYHAGKFTQTQDAVITLKTATPIHLMWSHGWFAQASLPVGKQGKILMEWKLSNINRFYETQNKYSATHNFTICAKGINDIVCSPDNIASPLVHLSLQNKNAEVYKVLENQSGQLSLKNDNHEKIISAYSPIDNLGLGLVVRINSDRLYSPLEKELRLITYIFLATNIIGAIVLYWQVAPRIRRLLVSEKEALHTSSTLKEIAYHDALTGLDNRLQIEKNILDAIDYAEHHQNYFALLFMDIDYFKKINDTLGHDAGDALLKTVARRLQLLLRSTDHIGRLGGDEFVILIKDILNVENVSDIARKILNHIHEPVELMGACLDISASIGISFYPQDGRDIASLMKNADIALYAAKDSGRNAFVFYKPTKVDAAAEGLASI